MPLYEYQCEDCGVRFEYRQSINDEALEICPECGGAVHRLIQPVGIIFKGSGFYVTDNRGKSSTAVPGHLKDSSKGSKEKESSSASESGSGSGSESNSGSDSGSGSGSNSKKD
jgi:putative FmdB family regulatory protein